MDSLTLSKRLYRSDIFTEELRIEGKLEPMGEVVMALGDPRRTCMSVYDATVTPVSAHNRLSAMAIPELVISKQHVVFVALLDAADYEGIRLAPNIHVLTVYTQNFVIQGEFHLGEETRVRDFVDILTLDFTPMTNARFFPLTPPKANFTPSYPFIIINKKLINMYHSHNAGR